MIRPYTAQDKKDVMALLKLNIPRYFDASEESDLQVYLEKLVEEYFVVEEQQQIVGAGGINYFRDEQLARISWDIIHPDFQRKGIGRQLLLHRIARIKKDTDIQCVMVRTTQMACRFYEKMGFALEKVEKDFWAEGFDLYQMKMVLERPGHEIPH